MPRMSDRLYHRLYPRIYPLMYSPDISLDVSPGCLTTNIPRCPSGYIPGYIPGCIAGYIPGWWWLPRVFSGEIRITVLGLLIVLRPFLHKHPDPLPFLPHPASSVLARSNLVRKICFKLCFDFCWRAQGLVYTLFVFLPPLRPIKKGLPGEYDLGICIRSID